MKQEEFIEEYIAWAKEKKYHQSRSKAEAVYELASGGIPTLSSDTPSTKMFVQEAQAVVRKGIESVLINHQYDLDIIAAASNIDC